MSNYLVRISIVLFLLAVFYSICLRLGSLDLFHSTFSKMAMSLGSRAVTHFLLMIGCSGGLALALGFALRALVTAEEMPSLENWMLPEGASGEGGSASTSSKQPNLPDLNLPTTEEDPEDQGDQRGESIERAVYQVELRKIQEQKNQLADHIRPLIEEEMKKFRRRYWYREESRPIPSPQEMVETIINRFASDRARGANAPNAPCEEFRHLKKWVTRACKNAQDPTQGDMSVQNMIEKIILESFQSDNEN